MITKVEHQRYILRSLLTTKKGSDQYRSFIDLCKKRYVEENVRYLESVYANLNSSDVYAMFIKDNSFWQINISDTDKYAIEAAMKQGGEADWGPTTTNIEDLLISNRILEDWLNPQVDTSIGNRPRGKIWGD
jgi:hypothetical protein